MFTYTGSPILTQSFTLPSDGDLADAASVNVSAMSICDMQSYLLQAYGQVMQSTAPIRIKQVNSTSLTVSPLSLIVVQEIGVWKSLFTTTATAVNVPADVEGGTFLKNRIYYLYVYSLAGVAKFQLSLTPPDVFHIFKQATLTHKFLGSVPSDQTTDNIMPIFSKYGSVVSVANNPAIASTLSSIEANSNLDVFIPLYLSGQPTRIKVILVVNSTSASDGTLNINSEFGGFGIPILIKAGAAFVVFLDLVTDSNNRIWLKGNSTDPLISLSVTLAGFIE